MSEAAYPVEPCLNCGTMSWPFGRICAGCKEVRWEYLIGYYGPLGGKWSRSEVAAPPGLVFTYAQTFEYFGEDDFEETPGLVSELTIFSEQRWVDPVRYVNEDPRLGDIDEYPHSLIEDYGVILGEKPGSSGTWRWWNDREPLLLLSLRLRNRFTGERIDLPDFPGRRTSSSISVASIDFAEVAGRLLQEGKKTSAALVDFMAGRERASFEEVARQVHGNGHVGEDAIRKNVIRTVAVLADMGARLSFRCSSGHVFREISPE